MADDRRKKEDFVENDRTVPGAARREAPRIATPLAPELKPGPAQAQGRRGGSMVSPVDTATPIPPGPTTLTGQGPYSAVPVPVLPERSSRNVAPVPAASDRSQRVGPIIERVREGRSLDDRLRESDEQPPVLPAPPPPGLSIPTPPVQPAPPPPQAIATPIVTPVVAPTPSVQAQVAAAALGGPVTQQTALMVPSHELMNTRETMHSGPPTSLEVRVHRLPPPARFDDKLFMLRAADSPVAASFRVLRHRLGEKKDLRVILVTSPNKGEGKTLCAVNLALALGEAGRARVLLLETNFRRPAIANLLGFRPPICFFEQLEFHHARPGQAWAVVENVSPWLHVAAVSPEAPSRPILDGPAIAQCVTELRFAGYDYIVLDSPPVLGSADVNLIEESVDGILLALWSRKSRTRSLRKAVEQVGSEKVLGVALLQEE